MEELGVIAEVPEVPNELGLVVEEPGFLIANRVARRS